MAARLGNIEILKRLQPAGGILLSADGDEPELEDLAVPSTTAFNRLLSRNVDSQTPPTVAVSANQSEGFRWLLERLRERHEVEK